MNPCNCDSLIRIVSEHYRHTNDMMYWLIVPIIFGMAMITIISTDKISRS